MKMRGRKIPGAEQSGLWAGLLTAVCACIPLTDGLSPFPAILSGASLGAGISPWLTGAGAVAGAILSRRLSPAIAFAAVLLTDRLFRRKKGEVRACISAMIAAAVSLWADGGDILPMIACCALGGALAPALVSGLQVKTGRRILAPEEKLSLAALAMLGVAGLACIHPAGAAAARIVSAAITLTAAREGAPQGALAGLMCGAACLGGAEFAAILGAGGAAAGALQGMNTGWAALGMLAACGICESCLGGRDWMLLLYIAVGGAAGVWPGQKYGKLIRLAVKSAENAQGRRHLREAKRSVGQMGMALSQCAETCAQGGGSESGCNMVSIMRERLCQDCADRSRCWSGRSPTAGRLFSSLSAKLSAGEGLDELPPDQVRFCRRAAQIPRRLAGVQAMAEQRRSALRERSMAAQMSAAPLKQAALLLQALEQDMDRCEKEDLHGVQCAAGALDKQGEESGMLSVAAGPGMAVEMCGRTAGWDSERVKRVAGLLSTALGGQYALQTGGRFLQTAEIRVEAGSCSREAAGGTVCGDHALCASLGDGRTALLLSDGMGRGADAAGESRCVVDLMHRLLLAGAQVSSAIDAVNSMMSLRSGDRFATLDLCIIDPYKKEASFYKLGACLSVLVRRKVCLRVEGGQLPPGIVEPAQPSGATLRLRQGDMIVMVTDGVADFAREGQEDWLTTTLATLGTHSADTLARALIHAAVKREKGKPGDDMTVLCARILANP